MKAVERLDFREKAVFPLKNLVPRPVFRDGVLYFYNSFLIKDLLKENGFKFDGERKAWFRRLYEDDVDFVMSNREVLQDVYDRVLSYVQSLKSERLFSDVEVPVPSGLSYYGYQKAFVKFALDKKHVLLADEMGLGKTVEVIALINAKRFQRVLIVCPAFLKFHWFKELQKWLVDEEMKKEVVVLDGKSLFSFVERQKSFLTERFIAIINYDVLYKYADLIKEKLFKDRSLYELTKGKIFDLVVWDESHYVKNLKAKRTQAFFEIKGLHEVFVTGTPILNRPEEVFPLLVKMGIYENTEKDYWKFAYSYCEVAENEYGKKIVGIKDAKGLRRLLLDFFIRRKREEVFDQLPSKVRILVRFDSSEVKKYVEAEMEIFKLKVLGKLEKRKEKEVREEKDYFTAEYEDYLKWFRIACEEDLRRYYLMKKADIITLLRLKHYIGLEKMAVAVEFLKNFFENVEDEKVVVMCWHRDVAWFVKSLLEKEGMKVEFFTGLDKPEERDRIAERFRTDDSVRAIVCTMKSAGLGISLVPASTMVFVEQSYVPGEILQAEDRICRIGQRSSVKVYHLAFSGSIDERIIEVINSKNELISTIVDGKEETDFFDFEKEVI